MSRAELVCDGCGFRGPEALFAPSGFAGCGICPQCTCDVPLLRRELGIRPASGRLAVLLPGLGAVSTTFIAGVEAVLRGAAHPVGSLSQLQTVRLGRRSEGRSPLIKDLLPLAELSDLVFGAWDPIPDNGLQAARRAGVLSEEHLRVAEVALAGIRPMRAAFSARWVKNLASEATNVLRVTRPAALVESLRADIRWFIKQNDCRGAVMVWCGSTEAHVAPGPADASPEALEEFLAQAEPDSVPPSMLYAYAAILEGVPYVNGAPNLSADTPAMVALAERRGVPIAGKDFKTGQTMLKSALAPALKARMLGLEGWFSTNILGNRDGLVLDDPESFRTKEGSKLGVLGAILQPDVYPELYGDAYHKVRIDYYPPRGDQKEGWDAIDIRGWLGYPMHLKVNFLCRDSILAAPLVLDLVLFMDLAARAGLSGVQEWLGFYFKAPQVPPDAGYQPEHDLFLQHMRLKNQLRRMAGEEELTHTEENDE